MMHKWEATIYWESGVDVEDYIFGDREVVVWAENIDHALEQVKQMCDGFGGTQE
jgi:hypothetical protein